MPVENKDTKGRDALIGFTGGAASAVIGLPFNKVLDPITSSTYRTALKRSLRPSEPKEIEFVERVFKTKTPNLNFGNYTKLKFRESFRPESAVSVGGSALKSGAIWATANLVINALNKANREKNANYQKAYPSLYRDLKLKPSTKHSPPKEESSGGSTSSKKVEHRWTPTSPDIRHTWAKMKPEDRKKIDELMSNFNPKVKNTNKDYVIALINKGKTMRVIENLVNKKMHDKHSTLF